MTVDADTRPLHRWLAAEDTPTKVVVACFEHDNLTAWRTPVTVEAQVLYRLEGCVADTPPAALLEILAAGAAQVDVLLDGCRDPSAAQEVVDHATRIAAAVDHDRPILVVSGPVPRAPHPSERSSRSWLKDHSARSPELVRLLDARSMPVPRRILIGAARSLPAPDPHPGVRLHAVVRELLGDDPVPAELDEIATGMAWLEAPGCGGAGVCVRACPVEALTLQMTDLTAGEMSPKPPIQQFELTIEPARCIDCGLCVDLCPESAISRVGALSWTQAFESDKRTLRAGLVRRCSRCGSPSRSAGTVCDVCAFRTANPFGSRLPSGFTRKRTV